MTIYLPFLEPKSLAFPPVEQALDEPDGLLAAGGDLSPARLEQAYRSGIFPWYSDPDPILWWSPSARCMLNPAQAHTSKSLEKFMRKHEFQVTWDQAFEDVIRCCSDSRRKQVGTWITPEMISAYCQLHRKNLAHSVEVWMDGELAGGLYGVSIGKAFFGESMFSLRTNASKIAFTYLARQLARWEFPLLDCQVYSDHVGSLGAKEVPRSDFLTILNKAIAQPGPKEWRFDG